MPRVFPFSSLWRQRPDDEIPGRIDRHVADRMRRLMIGVHLSSDLQTVSGSLVVTSGRGKFLRLQHSFDDYLAVPETVSDSLARLLDQTNGEGTQFPQVTADLAEVQAHCVRKLKIHAGKFVDRILAVTATDPGKWFRDFDGQISYQSLCHASRLAELTGLSVIDSLPDRDLAVGGAGSPIDILPSWLLFGDRSRRVANNTRVMLKFDRETEIVVLPPSDGIDDRLPNLQVGSAAGMELLQQLAKRMMADAPDFEAMYLNGRVEPDLLQQWSSHLTSDRQQIETLLSLADPTGSAKGIPIPNIFRTAFELIVQDVKLTVRSIRGDVPTSPIDNLWIVCPSEVESCLVNLVDQHFPACTTTLVRDADPKITSLPSTLAALHGLLHIDQLPANVPWLTGATAQRILGRLTPGTPASYRQLLVTMADYCPPAMKLRDAI